MATHQQTDHTLCGARMPGRFAAHHRVTAEMRVSLGLVPFVDCELAPGHDGPHSWQRRPREAALRLPWAGLFNRREATTPRPKPAPIRITKDADYYRRLSLAYACGEIGRKREGAPSRRELRRAHRRRRRAA